MRAYGEGLGFTEKHAPRPILTDGPLLIFSLQWPRATYPSHHRFLRPSWLPPPRRCIHMATRQISHPQISCVPPSPPMRAAPDKHMLGTGMPPSLPMRGAQQDQSFCNSLCTSDDGARAAVSLGDASPGTKRLVQERACVLKAEKLLHRNLWQRRGCRDGKQKRRRRG